MLTLVNTTLSGAPVEHCPLRVNDRLKQYRDYHNIIYYYSYFGLKFHLMNFKTRLICGKFFILYSNKSTRTTFSPRQVLNPGPTYGSQ